MVVNLIVNLKRVQCNVQTMEMIVIERYGGLIELEHSGGSVSLICTVQ